MIKAEYQHDLHLKQKVHVVWPNSKPTYWKIREHTEIYASSQTYWKKKILLQESSDAIDYKNLNIVDLIFSLYFKYF